MADRACNRCIAKKRRCDHARPVCGTCKKLKLDGECAYPPPQARRGPVAGMSRRAEHRAQQCENALWFLLNLPGVQDAVERVDPDILNRPFIPAPTAKLERPQRSDWWGEHTMRQPADVFMFRDACHRLQSEMGAPEPEPEQEQGPAPQEDGFEYDQQYDQQYDPGLEYDYDRSRSTPQPSDPHSHSHSNPNSHPPSRNGHHSPRREDERAQPLPHSYSHNPLPHAHPQNSLPQSRQRSIPLKREREREPRDRRRDDSAMRNAMGPSLWQLVSAAIPDEEEHEPERRGSPPPDREWRPAPMWSAPREQGRDEYEGDKRKRRADIFW